MRTTIFTVLAAACLATPALAQQETRADTIGSVVEGTVRGRFEGRTRTLPFAVVNNYGFAVLPMFVLMGVLAETAGLTSQVFYTADLWLRRFRGGLYQAVIVGSAMFAAISARIRAGNKHIQHDFNMHVLAPFRHAFFTV